MGFEFGASVTMDMREYMSPNSPLLPSSTSSPNASNDKQHNNRKAAANGAGAASTSSASSILAARKSSNTDQGTVHDSPSSARAASSASSAKERRITFKCQDSFFFTEFDGEWKVVERVDEFGNPECVVSYSVDVKPKGPVPVAALEWRIREDVPTNLRAVKRSAMVEGYEGVMAYRERRSGFAETFNDGKKALAGTLKDSIIWDRDETMAAYL